MASFEQNCPSPTFSEIDLFPLAQDDRSESLSQNPYKQLDLDNLSEFMVQDSKPEAYTNLGGSPQIIEPAENWLADFLAPSNCKQKLAPVQHDLFEEFLIEEEQLFRDVKQLVASVSEVRHSPKARLSKKKPREAKPKKENRKFVTRMAGFIFEQIKRSGLAGTTEAGLKESVIGWLPEHLRKKLETNRHYITRPVRLILKILNEAEVIYTDCCDRIRHRYTTLPGYLEFHRKELEFATKAKEIQDKKAQLASLQQKVLLIMEQKNQQSALPLSQHVSPSGENPLHRQQKPKNTPNVGVTEMMMSETLAKNDDIPKTQELDRASSTKILTLRQQPGM